MGNEQILLTSVGLTCLSAGIALKAERSDSRQQSLIGARYALAAIGILAAGLLWWRLAEAPSADNIFGYYPTHKFALLCVATYVLGWDAYFVLSRQRITNKLVNFSLSTTSALLLVGLLELPAAVGLIDYRLVFVPSKSVLFTRSKPWENPTYMLDKELGWKRRPGTRIAGESFGDLVYWLGIPTDQRYKFGAQYDSQGFRNDHEIKQAPVVLIGDSFLDWPLLLQADLLSSQLSQTLEVEVANLGHAGYGPQQELVVLRRYGLAPNPRVIVWLFFEGNDLLDIPRYEQLVQDWNIEELHSFKQRSFIKNALLGLAGLTGHRSQIDTGEAEKRSCRLLNSQNAAETKLYFAYAGSPLSEEELDSLDKARQIFSEAQQLAAESGAQFLLAFIPTKFRVYKDYCAFPEGSYGQDWHVNDLPVRIGNWAAEHEIPFIDLTPHLRERAASGELVFFTDDGHWNARGNEVAAQAIASFIVNNDWLAINHITVQSSRGH